MNCVPAEKTPEQLAREDIERQTLEVAAARLERDNVNSVYRQAMRRAARILRQMKP